MSACTHLQQHQNLMACHHVKMRCELGKDRSVCFPCTQLYCAPMSCALRLDWCLFQIDGRCQHHLQGCFANLIFPSYDVSSCAWFEPSQHGEMLSCSLQLGVCHASCIQPLLPLQPPSSRSHLEWHVAHAVHGSQAEVQHDDEGAIASCLGREDLACGNLVGLGPSGCSNSVYTHKKKCEACCLLLVVDMLNEV